MRFIYTIFLFFIFLISLTSVTAKHDGSNATITQVIVGNWSSITNFGDSLYLSGWRGSLYPLAKYNITTGVLSDYSANCTAGDLWGTYTNPQWSASVAGAKFTHNRKYYYNFGSKEIYFSSEQDDSIITSYKNSTTTNCWQEYPIIYSSTGFQGFEAGGSDPLNANYTLFSPYNRAAQSYIDFDFYTVADHQALNGKTTSYVWQNKFGTRNNNDKTVYSEDFILEKDGTYENISYIAGLVGGFKSWDNTLFNAWNWNSTFSGTTPANMQPYLCDDNPLHFIMAMDCINHNNCLISTASGGASEDINFTSELFTFNGTNCSHIGSYNMSFYAITDDNSNYYIASDYGIYSIQGQTNYNASIVTQDSFPWLMVCLNPTTTEQNGDKCYFQRSSISTPIYWEIFGAVVNTTATFYNINISSGYKIYTNNTDNYIRLNCNYVEQQYFSDTFKADYSNTTSAGWDGVVMPLAQYRSDFGQSLFLNASLGFLGTVNKAISYDLANFSLYPDYIFNYYIRPQTLGDTVNISIRLTDFYNNIQFYHVYNYDPSTENVCLYNTYVNNTNLIGCFPYNQSKDTDYNVSIFTNQGTNNYSMSFQTAKRNTTYTNALGLINPVYTLAGGKIYIGSNSPDSNSYVDNIKLILTDFKGQGTADGITDLSKIDTTVNTSTGPFLWNYNLSCYVGDDECRVISFYWQPFTTPSIYSNYKTKIICGVNGTYNNTAKEQSVFPTSNNLDFTNFFNNFCPTGSTACELTVWLLFTALLLVMSIGFLILLFKALGGVPIAFLVFLSVIEIVFSTILFMFIGFIPWYVMVILFVFVAAAITIFIRNKFFSDSGSEGI